jgi:hypothetical protein
MTLPIQLDLNSSSAAIAEFSEAGEAFAPPIKKKGTDPFQNLETWSKAKEGSKYSHHQFVRKEELNLRDRPPEEQAADNSLIEQNRVAQTYHQQVLGGREEFFDPQAMKINSKVGHTPQTVIPKSFSSKEFSLWKNYVNAMLSEVHKHHKLQKNGAMPPSEAAHEHKQELHDLADYARNQMAWAQASGHFGNIGGPVAAVA